jgi:putative methyltransferase (TIGR04325 family)
MVKKIAKLLIPPLFYTLKDSLNKGNKISFSGDFTSWDEINSILIDNYSSDEILDNVKKASLKVKNGDALFERDSVCFYESSYRYPILSHLLYATSCLEGELSVLDFGGSLGSFYHQHRKYLDRISWNIVEQENFVKVGQESFEDGNLKFYYSMQNCFNSNKIDIVFLSSVMQYLESPYTILEQIFKFAPKFILLDRTSFVDGNRDLLTIQNIPKKIYSASLPCWFFSKRLFINNFDNNGYELIEEIDCDELFNIGEFKGMFFKRKDI